MAPIVSPGAGPASPGGAARGPGALRRMQGLSTLPRALLCCLALAAASATGHALAQPAAGTPNAPAPAASAASRAPALPHQRVIEDDKVRIEEVLVRGQPVRVTVHSKLPGVRPYEVNVGSGGRDPSQERGSAGQSAWRLFSF
jgi:hypothetical protein